MFVTQDNTSTMETVIDVPLTSPFYVYEYTDPEKSNLWSCCHAFISFCLKKKKMSCFLEVKEENKWERKKRRSKAAKHIGWSTWSQSHLISLDWICARCAFFYTLINKLCASAAFQCSSLHFFVCSSDYSPMSELHLTLALTTCTETTSETFYVSLYRQYICCRRLKMMHFNWVLGGG